MPPKKKKLAAIIKLQIQAGAGHPGAAGRPRARPARRQHHGVLQGLQRGHRVAARATSSRSRSRVYEDRSFTFVLKTPPAARLLIKAAGVEKGSGEPHTHQGRLDHAWTRCARSPQTKMADLNANDIDGREKIIAGTARSMGITIKD